ncbi:uncharacterized protein ARMOST_09338 [Armillaria ostoyae]|uniref:Uncharacterized protein n=1 Tax=Armillaria ostoyae TaxID=47428 RepID=A0A284RB84_ARMOS|nr:uncharacterized protein ARMOST_09338 [Armillaria ostoyae]
MALSGTFGWLHQWLDARAAHASVQRCYVAFDSLGSLFEVSPKNTLLHLTQRSLDRLQEEIG